jgi:hypothetical protein
MLAAENAEGAALAAPSLTIFPIRPRASPAA